MFLDSALDAEAARRGLARPQAEIAIFVEALHINLDETLLGDKDFRGLFLFSIEDNVNQFIFELKNLNHKVYAGELSENEAIEIAKQAAFKTQLSKLSEPEKIDWIIKLRDWLGPCGSGAVTVKDLLEGDRTTAFLASILNLPMSSAYRIGKPLIKKWGERFPRAVIQWDKAIGDWAVKWR
jgi:hypothetical protein